MPELLASLNGRLLPYSEARLPLHDAGFVFGATVTDLFRTFRHQLYRWDDHLQRFRQSCRLARIPLPADDHELTTTAHSLVAHNKQHLSPQQDLALVLFATPGPLGHYAGEAAAAESTWGMHTFPLAFARYRPLFVEGARLVVPSTRHVSPTSMNPHIKQRSRLHWWIAEREANEIEPGAMALLLDAADHVTETASANLLIVKVGIIKTPPRHTVLGGISLKILEEMCNELAIPFQEEALTLDDCRSADEAMLSCTSFCLAPVRSIHGTPIASPGPVFRRLIQHWSLAVGVDIRSQMVGEESSSNRTAT